MSDSNLTEKNLSEQPITERYLNIVNELMDQQLLTMTQNVNAKITEAITAKQGEIYRNLTAAFGTEKAMTIHPCDLPTLGRKLALENTPTGKKTPASIEKAGPEGTGNAPNPLDKVLKSYGVAVK